MNTETPPPRLVSDRPSNAAEWLLDLMGEWDFTIPVGAFGKIAARLDAAAEAPGERDSVDQIGALLFRDWDANDRREGGAMEFYRAAIRRLVEAPGRLDELDDPAPADEGEADPVAMVTSSGINYTGGALPLGTKLYTAPRVTGGREEALLRACRTRLAGYMVTAEHSYEDVCKSLWREIERMEAAVKALQAATGGEDHD